MQSCAGGSEAEGRSESEILYIKNKGTTGLDFVRSLFLFPSTPFLPLLPPSSQLACVSGNVVPVRHLNIHEYQSKRLMEQYGCNTQRFKMAENAQEAETATRELGTNTDNIR